YAGLSLWFYDNLNRTLLRLEPRAPLSRKLFLFYREHHYLTRHLMFLNSNFISRNVSIFLLLNLPFNAYTVSYLILNRLPPLDWLIFAVVWTAQVAGFGYSFLASILINQQIHGCARHLHPLQLRMKFVKE